MNPRVLPRGFFRMRNRLPGALHDAQALGFKRKMKVPENETCKMPRQDAVLAQRKNLAERICPVVYRQRKGVHRHLRRSFFDVPDSFLLPPPRLRSMVDALSGDNEYCIAK